MKKLNKKSSVGILGATGMVGQRFVCLLKDHPWFTVTYVAASRKSSGKTYEQAVKGRWSQKESIPKDVGEFIVGSIEDDLDTISQKCSFVFSAIDADKDFIKKIEEAYAKAGLPVISNNSAHRWTSDIPMIMPEINPHHLDIIPIQKKNRGWTTGFIVTKPNCSIQSYAPLLFAWRNFQPQKVIVSTYQAISGAGKTFETWPEMIDNVVPYIGGEEEKSEQEPLKIFGEIKDGKLIPDDTLQISANCMRVPTSDGHLATINIQFAKNASKEKLIERNPPKAINYAEDFLKKRNVKLIFNNHIKGKIKNKWITNKGLKLNADLVFICTGITPNFDFIKKNFSYLLNYQNHIKVNGYLQVDGKQNIFAVGDVNNIVEEKTAQNAKRQAKLTLKNICNLEKNKNLEEYVPKKTPLVISLGKRKGIFVSNNFVLTGFIPSLMKDFIEFKEMLKKKH